MGRERSVGAAFVGAWQFSECIEGALESFGYEFEINIKLNSNMK